MRHTGWTTAACVLALCVAPAWAQREIHVELSAASGGDGSAYSPVRTIGGGLYKLKQPGDTLVVKRGLYVGSITISGLKGRRGAPITIRGIRETPTEEELKQPNIHPAKWAPVIKATGEYSIHIKDCSYVTVEGLLVTGATSHGIYIENSDHVEIRGSDVYDNVGSQLHFESAYHPKVEKCMLAGSAIGHGVEFHMADKAEIRDCRIYNNSGAGIYLHANKLGGNGLLENPIVERNRLWENGKLRPGVALPRDRRGRPIKPASLRYGAAAISADGAESGVFRNNIIHHTHQGGFVLYREDAERAGQNNAITHNSIYMGEKGGKAFGIYLALMSQRIYVQNNIIVTAQGPCVWLGKGASRELRSDHNIFFRLDNGDPMQREKENLSLERWKEVYRNDRNSIIFGPEFDNPKAEDLAEVDLKLTAKSSLAHRAPFDGRVPDDAFGNWRQRNRVTPGAHELRPSSQSPYHRGQPNKQTTPNQPNRPRPHHRGGDDDKDKKDPPPDDGGVVLPPL